MNRSVFFTLLCSLSLLFSHAQPCLSPSNVQVLSYNSNSITIDWTTGGSTVWQIRYVPTGGNITTATPINVYSKPYTINGLSQATEYQIEVRDSCNTTLYSFWSSSLFASTNCNPVTPPFTSNFDGAAWDPGLFTTDPGTINSCWKRYDSPSGSYIWKVGPTAFVSTLSGASNDNTTGSGQYMYMEGVAFSSISNDSTILESPDFDLSTLTSPEISFYYHMHGADIDDLKVFVSDDFGASYSELAHISGPQHFSNTDAWTEKIINLSNYVGQTIRVRLIAYENSTQFNNAICIDDFTVQESPTCPRPQTLSTVSLSSNSATISWISGGATNWNIEYGASGFSPGTGTLINANTNPFTITGLSSNTDYDIYVRDSCGPGDVSIWTGPLSISTLCSALSAPYLEDFEGSTFVTGSFFNDPASIDNCWTRSATTTFFWKVGPPWFVPTTTGPQNDHTLGTSSGKYMFSESSVYTGTVSSTYLESPLIDLSPLTAPQLTFWVHMFGADISQLKVEIDDGSGYSQVNLQSGQQHSSKTSQWKEVIVNLSAYAGDTIRLRFDSERLATGFDTDIAIDDIEIDEAPSCPKPQNLTNTSLGFNKATFTWLTGGASNWNLSYGSPGFSPGSGTIVNTNTNPETITGLSASTTYEVYVRDSCGPGDVSPWTGPISITTKCSPVSAPYTENFDAAGFVVSPNAWSNGAFPSCWTPTDASFAWSVENDDATTSLTGPSQDHTSGTGKYIYSQALFTTLVPSSDMAELNSRLIDLSPLTVPEMAFWYHMYGTEIDSLAIYIDNGYGVHRVYGISGQQQSSQSALWKEAIVDLSSFANDTIGIVFKAYRNPSTGFNQAEMAIDDLSIYEQPNCPKPTNFISTSNSTTSITLSWTTGGASNWQIEYGPSGFSPGSGTIVNVSSNPYTVNNLSPSSGYDFYVRDSCGTASTSTWSGPINARTLCGISVAPFLENFDGVNFTPSSFWWDPGIIDPCWSRSDTTNYWWTSLTASQLFNTGPLSDNTTGNGNFLATSLLGYNNTSTTIESPLIDLSPLTNPELRFYSYRFGGAIDKLEVDVWNGSTWINELTLNGQSQSSQLGTWDEHSVSLSSYAGDTIAVRFVAYRLNSFSYEIVIGIDDFEIREAPTCPKPSNLSAMAVSSTAIEVSWTTGGASNWNVQYRPNGSTGPYTFVATNSNPYTINGLNASTTYEIWVRDSCGAGDVSEWLGPITQSTDCGLLNFPHNENFDGSTWVATTDVLNTGNQIDSCWSRPSANNPNFGTRFGTTTSNSGPSSDVSGNGNYIYTESSAGATGAGEISSPSILVPNNQGTPYLKFAYHMYGSNIVSLEVDISVNGGAFTNVWSLLGQQQSGSASNWLYDSVDLSNYINDTIVVKFIGTNNGFGGDIAVDDVSFYGTILPCNSPSSLSFLSVGQDSVTVAWASSNPGSITSLSYYDVSLGASSAITIPNVTSPYVLNGLSLNTSYVISVWDTCVAGNVSDTISDTATTNGCDTINSNFTSSANYLGASFDASSTLYADSVYWVINGDTLYGFNPSYNFSAAGNYAVTLYAFNNCGFTDTLIRNIFICDTLVAQFAYQSYADSVFFDASSSSNASGYFWDLDDGFSASGQTTGVRYNTVGTKTITLFIYNACGDTISTSQTITLCPPAIPNWTYEILDPINSGMRVQFDGTLSTNALTYNWDFGDGNTGTGPTPIHIYGAPSLFYLVELTVTNSCGDEFKKAFQLNEIGLDEFATTNDFKLYPNPSNGISTLEWNPVEIKVLSLDIYSLNGQKLIDITLNEKQMGSTKINLENLSSGIYQIFVNTKNERIRIPLVLE